MLFSLRDMDDCASERPNLLTAHHSVHFCFYVLARLYRVASLSNYSTGTAPTDVVDLVEEIRPLCIRLTYWAVVIIVAGTAHMMCWKLTSDRQVSRLRAELFSAILHQDCVWFDSHDTGALTVVLTK